MQVWAWRVWVGTPGGTLPLPGTAQCLCAATMLAASSGSSLPYGKLRPLRGSRAAERMRSIVAHGRDALSQHHSCQLGHVCRLILIPGSEVEMAVRDEPVARILPAGIAALQGFHNRIGQIRDLERYVVVRG